MSEQKEWWTYGLKVNLVDFMYFGNYMPTKSPSSPAFLGEV